MRAFSTMVLRVVLTPIRRRATWYFSSLWGYFLVDRLYRLAYELLLGYFFAFIGRSSAQGLLFINLEGVVVL